MATLTLEEFLPKARSLNPDYTDDEHIQAYEQRYGRTAPVQTVSAAPLRTFEEFLPKARALNPEYSDDEHRAAWEERYGSRGAREKDQGDFVRGAKETVQQIPQLAAGLEAGAGAVGEKAFGKGGVFTSLKEHGLRNYREIGQEIAADSKPSDSISEAYKMARAGDPGALVDWLQHSLGYAGGQAIQMLATAGIGYAGGKVALKTLAETAAEKLIAKESARLSGTQAGMALGAEELRRQAVSNVAGKIGVVGALGSTAVGMEGGEIYGGLVDKADREGRSLTGEELAKATGATLAAGGLEFVGDRIGLNLVLGKNVASKLVSSRLGNAAVSGGVGAVTEGGTEFTQTLLEEFGKGNDPFSPESIKQAVDASAIGAVGGTAIGTAGGLANQPQGATSAPIVTERQPEDLGVTQPEILPPAGPRQITGPPQPGEIRDGKVFGGGPVIDVSPIPDVSSVTNASTLDEAIANAVGVVQGATEQAKSRAAEFSRMTAKARNDAEDVMARAPEKRPAIDVPILPAPVLSEPAQNIPGIIPGQVFTPRTEPEIDPRQSLADERARMIAQRDEQQASVNRALEQARMPRNGTKWSDLAFPQAETRSLPQEPARQPDKPLPTARQAGIEKAYPSVDELHRLAESKGLQWDNNKTFMELTKMATGKRHLDELTPVEREKFAQTLNKIKASEPVKPVPPPKVETPAPQVELTPIKQPSAAVTSIPEAQVPRSQLPPEQNAEMLLRAEKGQADLEIAGRERGGRFFSEQTGQGGTPEVVGLKSPTADWYKELTTGPRPLKRQQIDTAIQKIIKNHGVDTGVAVERVKEALLKDREFNKTPWGEDADSIARGEWPSWIEKPNDMRVKTPVLGQENAQTVDTSKDLNARTNASESAESFQKVPRGTIQPSREVKLYRGVSAGRDARSTEGTSGQALFYSPDRLVAQSYAGKGGTIVEDAVSFSNLLSAENWVDAKNKLGLKQSNSMEDLIQAAREAGHDGITFKTKNGQEYISIPQKTEAKSNTPAQSEITSADTSNREAGGFDAEAFDRREQEIKEKIKQSKSTGNKHLDQLPQYVESMRGVRIKSIRDGSTGVVTAVTNLGDTNVQWDDKASAESNLASEEQTKTGVEYHSRLTARDLPEFIVQPGGKAFVSKGHVIRPKSAQKSESLRKEAEKLKPTASLDKTASWVIRDKKTGKAVMETFNPSVAKNINTDKYEAVPIQEHLVSINTEEKRAQKETPPTPEESTAPQSRLTGKRDNDKPKTEQVSTDPATPEAPEPASVNQAEEPSSPTEILATALRNAADKIEGKQKKAAAPKPEPKPSVSDRMYEEMWKKVQRGFVKEDGEKSVYLDAAKRAKAKGALKDQAELRPFIERVSAVVSPKLSAKEQQRAIDRVIDEQVGAEQKPSAKNDRLTKSQEALDNNPYEVRDGEDSSLNYDIAKDALGDLDRAGGVSTTGRDVYGPRIPAKTVALSISPDLIRQGTIDLTGYHVASPEDVAKLAQVYRDPRFETFRFIYVNGTKIVGHEGLTSRMPGFVMVFRSAEHAEQKMTEIRTRMESLGATGYYMLHNHPSGNSTPSGEDIRMTEVIADNLPGFKGHVVIDSNEYSTLMLNSNNDVETKTHELDLGEDRLLKPSVDHPLLNTPAGNPLEVAAIGKAIQPADGYVTVIYTTRGQGNDIRSRVRAIQEVSADFLADEQRARAYIEEQTVAFGSRGVFVHASKLSRESGARLGQAMDRLIRDGFLRDYVVSSDSGEFTQSRMEEGVEPAADMVMGKARKDAQSFSVQEDETGTLNPPQAREHLKVAQKSTRPYLLGALGLEQISQVYGKDHAEVHQYNKATQAMEADFVEMSRGSEQVVKSWTALKVPVADTMARVMEDARFLNFDPDPKKNQEADSQKKKDLRTRFGALPDDAQATYRLARDFYTDMAEKRFQALKERIERAGGTPENTKKLVDRLQLAYEQVRSKVYFPFTRFGENIVVAKQMKDGKETDREVHAFESVAEAQQFATLMKMKGWTVKQTVAKQYSLDKEGPASKIVRQMHDIIKELDDNRGVEGTADTKEFLLDSLNQSFLQALPDMSYAKHFIHAKDVKGASKDALRAFAHSALHGAHHISRIKHADRLTDALSKLDERINETAEGDVTEARQVFNELVNRHNEILNPSTSPVSAWLGQLGFTMSLGGVVATGVTNATQVPLITYPWLGARFGFGKASAALARAYKDFLDPKTLNKDSLFDVTKSARISETERKMLLELARRGRIDLTQTMDLAGLSAQDNLSRVARQIGTTQGKVMRMLGFTFHAPEVMNRQVTALSTFRLEKERGGSFDKALQRAEQAIIDTHFLYQAFNRPRYMSGNFLRVLTMFKQYSQNIAFLYGRAASVWLDKNNATKEERAIAKSQLLSMLALQFGAAGALGLPFFGAATDLLMSVVGAFDDDDEKRDWEVALRKWLDGKATSLAEAFLDDKKQAGEVGKKIGEVISHGASRLTPWDMASRLGQQDLFFRAPQREREGRQAAMDWFTSLGGPVPGYLTNAFLGVQDVSKGIKDANLGFIMRGIEELTPAVLRNGVKSLRYAIEDVRTRDQYKQLEVDTSEKLGQFFGFTPRRVAEMYESTTAVKNLEHRMDKEKKDLLQRFSRSVQERDMKARQRVMEDIRQFNSRNRMFGITSDTLNRSMKARMQHERGMERGMFLPPKRRELLSEGDFGDF